MRNRVHGRGKDEKPVKEHGPKIRKERLEAKAERRQVGGPKANG